MMQTKLEQQIEAAPTDTLESIAWGEEHVGRAGRASSIKVIKSFMYAKPSHSRTFILVRLANNGFSIEDLLK